MNVGFLGFGEVASTLSAGLIKEGVKVYTCLDGRSSRSVQRAHKVNINVCSNKKLLESMDILLSTVTPSQAIPVAQNVSSMNGIYVDLNNISPKTVKSALSQINNAKTVDAAIMGSVIKNGLKVKIIASGPHASEFAELNDFGLNIEVIGSEIGQASAIKMLRSAYTKGVSALLLESLYTAYKMGVDNQVLGYISDTECPEFTESAISRIINSTFHVQRKLEEMREVKALVSQETEPIMNSATLESFEKLSQNVPQSDIKPTNIRDIFKTIDSEQRQKDP